VQELPFHYGLVARGGDPLEFWMSDGRKLNEADLFGEFPQAYRYWKQTQTSPNAARVIGKG
jgi:hypothetical protein